MTLGLTCTSDEDQRLITHSVYYISLWGAGGFVSPLKCRAGGDAGTGGGSGAEWEVFP